MSEAVLRDYSLTVRLSPDERAELEALAEHWQLDRSATVRRAVQAVSGRYARLPLAGRFVTGPRQTIVFPIRLKPGGADER